MGSTIHSVKQAWYWDIWRLLYCYLLPATEERAKSDFPFLFGTSGRPL